MADVTLANLNDLLRIQSVTWDIKRRDELSGVGDGRVFAAEMAAPLWTADVQLTPAYHNDAKQIGARLRALRGPMTAFMLCDPVSLYPQADPDGTILGTASVVVSAVSSGRDAISFLGLPNAYALTIGDKVQITDSSDSTKTGFFEFSGSASANASGILSNIPVFPHLPAWVGVGDVVTLKKPACRMTLMPSSHNPGTSDPALTTGQSFQAIQRK